jgi:hypothetical protein
VSTAIVFLALDATMLSRRCKGFCCEIIPADPAFLLRLSLPGRGVVSGRFATEGEARVCLFDRMEADDVHRYFAKRFPGRGN